MPTETTTPSTQSTISAATTEVFRTIFAKIPDKYRPFAVIAGGAAADFTRARDIDVFLLGSSTRRLRKLKGELRAIPGFITEDASSPYNVECEVVGRVDLRVGKPVQFIATAHRNIVELLHGFDISTHCVAYSSELIRHTCLATTGLTETPQLVDVRFPHVALGRYRKICLRYNLEPDPRALVTLCKTPDYEIDECQQETEPFFPENDKLFF